MCAALTVANIPVAIVNPRQVRGFAKAGGVASTRHNPIIRAYYRRLRDDGKPPKVALIACMHKLLNILSAMAKSGTPWSYQSVPI